MTSEYSEITNIDTGNIRYNPISNRIEVCYNDEWLNYPPSFAGNSIYLIQNGALLIPYTMLMSGFSIKEQDGEVIFYIPTHSGASEYYAGIRFDKIVQIDEPYELHIEAYVNSTGSPFTVCYSNKELSVTSSVYDGYSEGCKVLCLDQGEFWRGYAVVWSAS